MDELENKPLSNPEPSVTELQEQCDSLRHLVGSVLILCIVVSGTFNLFLLRQVKYTRLDLQGFRPQAQQMITEYNKTSAPAMGEFLRKLIEYGKSHPDFTPIMNKYGLKPEMLGTNSPVTPAAKGAPTPISTSPATTPAATPPKK